MTTATEEATKPVVTTNEARAAFLEERLTGDGLFVWVDTNDGPQHLRGECLKQVIFDSAWVSFSLDGKTIRTKTIRDRNRFVEWIDSGGEAPFSLHKEHREKSGPPDVTFSRLCALKTV